MFFSALMMNPPLFETGKEVVDRHVKSLQEEKTSKVYYKVLLPNGKLGGRAIVEDGPKYREHVAHHVPLQRLSRNDTRRMGNPCKYEHAFRSIVIPCGAGGCRLQYCGYCSLRRNGHTVPEEPAVAQHFLLQTMVTKKWDVFKKENNLAPTKVVCKLLWNDERYMEMLQRCLENSRRHHAASIPEDAVAVLVPPCRSKRKRLAMDIHFPVLGIPPSVATSSVGGGELMVYGAYGASPIIVPRYPVIDVGGAAWILWVTMCFFVLVRKRGFGRDS
jgi:hypothetical protein